MDERHVVPDRGGGQAWKIVGAGTGATESHATSQSAAIEEACSELADAGGGEVVIHGLNGTVQDTRTVSPEQGEPA